MNLPNKEWISDIFSPDLRKLAVIGAKGSAKSTYTFKLLLAIIFRGGRRKILLTCGTREQVSKLFKQQIYDQIKLLPMSSSNFTSLEFEFENGIILHLKSVETAKTAEGLEYDCWFADEFQDHTEEAVKVFHSRTRRARQMCLFRVVGMPDDPSHFMYQYFQENGYKLHEITLFDHPSQEWIDYYSSELSRIYSGSMLDRYLYGKRVSLTGLGAFTIPIECQKEFSIEPNIPLQFVWDFNVEYRAVLVGQYYDEKIHILDSYQMTNPLLSTDAEEVISRYSSHKGGFILDGDASGENRSAAATESMWQQIKAVFNKHNARSIVPRKNPNVKDSIQIAQWGLKESRIIFHKDAVKMIGAISNAKLDKYGEIDKSKDYSNSPHKSHEVDVFRYFVYSNLKKHFPTAKPKVIQGFF